jgi:hypothetical protein
MTHQAARQEKSAPLKKAALSAKKSKSQGEQAGATLQSDIKGNIYLMGVHWF